eukprot:5788021-Alexandrium_andersonii.AAC.1
MSRALFADPTDKQAHPLVRWSSECKEHKFTNLESIVQATSEKERGIIAPGVRTWNRAGPGAASKLLPEAPDG